MKWVKEELVAVGDENLEMGFLLNHFKETIGKNRLKTRPCEMGHTELVPTGAEYLEKCWCKPVKQRGSERRVVEEIAKRVVPNRIG